MCEIGNLASINTAPPDQSHSYYTSYRNGFVIFNIWMTVSDYSSNPTVIILVGIGILTKCMFYLLISG
jgi:hypothetical protein